jgi:hemerythrin superfamily protein
MTTSIKTDLITLLEEDHRLIEGHIKQMFEAAPERREELYFLLTQRVIAHEAAEEHVVYPMLRSLPGGELIAEKRIAEQAEAERQILEIERLHATSQDFARDVHRVLDAILRHSKAEEQTAFALLRSELSHDELTYLGDKYLHAKHTGPTHPHPYLGHSTMRVHVFAPLAARFDRIRDRLRHPERKVHRPGVRR